MRATVCGHHVRQRNDEKLADPRSDDLHIVGQKLRPPKQRAAPEVHVTPSSDAAKIDAPGLVDVCAQRRSLCDGV